MTKVSIKPEKTTPFGDFYYTNKAFNAHSIAKVINKVLDIRTTNIKIIY